MAATAVYARITRVPLDGGTVDDGYLASNISATTAAFRLQGGRYTIEVIGATFGTVTLGKVGPDGSTVLTVLAAFSANGVAVVDASIGDYKLTIA